MCSLDVCLAAASTDACVNIRQRAKTCRFTIAEFLGSYPREASSFGPARGCNVDSGLPLHNNSAHISFTPTVTYSLTPGMTAVPGQTALGVCSKLGRGLPAMRRAPRPAIFAKTPPVLLSKSCYLAQPLLGKTHSNLGDFH